MVNWAEKLKGPSCWPSTWFSDLSLYLQDSATVYLYARHDRPTLEKGPRTWWSRGDGIEAPSLVDKAQKRPLLWLKA